MKKWMFVCLILVLGVMQVQGAIVHRYGMSDPNDSVGSANAVLVKGIVNSTSGFADGQLFLGNPSGLSSNIASGAIDYLDLPNGIISALGTQMTIETWTTWKAGNMWSRIFDFGVSGCGENSSCGNGSYIMLTPYASSNYLRCGILQPGVEESRFDAPAQLVAGVEQHIVVTYDEVKNSVRMYLNGVEVGTQITGATAVPVGFKLSSLNDVNNWLGRSQWGDDMYGGNYNEFRLYNHPMSPSEVAASFKAGTEISVATPISPADGQIDVSQTPTLEWASGFIPTEYTNKGFRVVLSKTLTDVQNTVTTAILGDEIATTSYTIPSAKKLETDITYYWRVDEKVIIPGSTDPNYVLGGIISFNSIKSVPILTGSTLAYGLAGGSVKLNVNIQTISDIKPVSWCKFVDGTNDTLLSANSKYAISQSNTLTTLTISNFAVEDVGQYYVKVENASNTPITSSQINAVLRTGQLVHRYSFDGNADPQDMTVIDSVGGKNGTLIIRTPANNTRYESGKLILGNTGQGSNSGTGDYVDLPNGMISALGNLATFEVWVSWRGPVANSWQRIFDFGTSGTGEDVSNSGDNQYYVMLTPRSGDTVARFGYKLATGNAERTLNLARGPLPADSELVHVAVVWDGTIGKAKLYYNGQFIVQNDLHFALSNIVDNNNWLGRAQYPDPLFRGSYDEFRIYDVPLTDDAVLAHFQAGPNVIGVEKPCTAFPAGDANKDCKVDMNDLAAMAANWLLCGGPMCQ